MEARPAPGARGPKCPGDRPARVVRRRAHLVDGQPPIHHRDHVGERAPGVRAGDVDAAAQEVPVVGEVVPDDVFDSAAVVFDSLFDSALPSPDVSVRASPFAPFLAPVRA